MSRRGFLFLQGLASRFFERLGYALLGSAHEVWRVNFNGGDRAFWRLPGTVDFAGRQSDWPEFLNALLLRTGISDIILFGDCRPLHRVAIRLARARGVAVHVVEEGYLRPGWITFERGGVNGHSSLPRDPQWYHEAARALPPWRDPPPVEGTFGRRAAADLLYASAMFRNRRRFPYYLSHRPYHQFVEYAGWVRRLALGRKAARKSGDTFAALCRSGAPFFMCPLQLDCDYQIRVHSPDRAMAPAVARIIGSFARYAPRSSRLLLKLHPLDSGLLNWPAVIQQFAAECDVLDRIEIVDGCDLDILLAHAQGVVTVNSTVGIRALARGIPVKVLGRAVYDLPGLTFGAGLDEFWRAPGSPDRELFDAFRRVLASRALIPGDFFSTAGLQLAVSSAVDRLKAIAAAPAAFNVTAPSISDAVVGFPDLQLR